MNNPAGWSNTVSLGGIDRAIEALGYRKLQSPKYRLVDAIRSNWVKSSGTGAKGPVGADELIRILWGIPEELSVPVSRRRNLSSLRSSINSDLMALFRNGENPEGVIIGPDYMFTICDEAKDQALATLRELAREGGPDLQRIEEILKGVKQVLGDREKIGNGASESGSSSLEAIREAIRGLADELGVLRDGKKALYEEALEEAFEDVEVAEDEEEEGVIVEDDALDEEADEEAPELEEAEEDDLCGEDLEEVLEDVEVAGDEEEEGVIVEDDALDEEADEEAPELEEAEEDDLCGEDLEDVFEDVEVAGDDEGGVSGPGLVPDERVGSEDWDGSNPLDPEKARLLAETFNDSLAAMDRFYNQYIFVPQGVYRVHVSSSNGDDSCEVQVSLSEFFIGKFPVTNALFEVFVEKTGYRTSAERTGYGMVYHGRYRRCVDEESGKETLTVRSGIVCTRVKGACWYRPSGPDSNLRNKRNHPVVQVSLEDAMAFAAWTGKRLPTEEEWEGAMRTADGNLLPWGDVWERDACNVEESWEGDTSPADRFLPYANPLGLADGVGNVLEWTITVDGEDAHSLRVAKGSSWIAGSSITLGSRIALPRETCSNILGFRCVAY